MSAPVVDASTRSVRPAEVSPAGDVAAAPPLRRGDRPGPSGPRPGPGLIALLGAMSAVFAVTVDMYLPSLPQVAAEMGVSDASAQLTISFMMVGAALGQLVIGPWSDRVGRRLPVLIGASIHIAASLAVLLGSGFVVFLGLRLLQGVGAAALGVCAQAFIRDRYTGATAAAALSRLLLVIGVAPLFAPTIGGFIASVWDWRTVFAVLAGLGFFVLVLAWRFLPESHPVEARTTGGLRAALGNYKILLSDRRFVGLAILPGLVTGALISYVSGSPFVLQEELGLSAAQFSAFFAVGGIALVGMAQVNAAIVHRFSPRRIIGVALPLQLTTILLMLASAITGVGGTIGFLLLLIAAISFQNFVPPNASALALGRHGERAGAAAAVLGALGALIPATISPLVGVLGGTSVAMATVMACSITAALVVVIVATPVYRRS